MKSLVIVITALLLGTSLAANAQWRPPAESTRCPSKWGAGDELSAIAAVILGGTSLFGGSGTIVGTFFGALLVGLINNGLILAGLPVSQQQIIRGMIIILAVALAKKK